MIANSMARKGQVMPYSPGTRFRFIDLNIEGTIIKECEDSSPWLYYQVVYPGDTILYEVSHAEIVVIKEAQSS
jgi:hypothetical protein